MTPLHFVEHFQMFFL